MLNFPDPHALHLCEIFPVHPEVCWANGMSYKRPRDFLKDVFYFHVYACVSVCGHVRASAKACGVQKRASDIQEVVVSHPVRLLRAKQVLWRAASSLLLPGADFKA